ncbi:MULTISPECIES: DUF6843 domain-containing protein [unclassified Paenibacillus]|uniref:DUF6843 domain-containing protein n=1 Tax=unclassified Paenibacillus TaxID=185978 RepID=UPI0036D254E0
MSIVSDRTTHKYLLPEGFTGWIQVTYEQPEHPPLKTEGKKLVYEVPPSGKIVTSSKNATGPMELNYIDQEGKQKQFRTDIPLIHGLGTSSGESSTGELFPEKVTFFVGTEQQWREAADTRPSLHNK